MIKFNPAEDDDHNLLYQRIVSEDGKIEIAIHPVIFGYRVRAGYVGDGWVQLDWCGGNDQAQLELLYSIAKNILEHKGNFEGVPGKSNIKPFYKDFEFVDKILSLTTGKLDVIKLKSLHECRVKMLATLL